MSSDHANMNDVQRSQTEGARHSAVGHYPEDQDDFRRSYLDVALCPCCGAPAASAEQRVASSPPAETLHPDRHGKFLSGYTNARVFFTYFECANCSAMFCRTYYRQSQLDGLYGRQAENMVSVPLEARKRTQDEYIGLLRRHSRMAGNFLEIGPDIGLFASSFAKVGSFDRFWLYEPNTDVHQALAENFRGLNHSISASIFRASDVPPDSISTAVLIHVLDHLLEPADFLREIRSSLEPGGVIFIVTHDCASMLARVLGRRWPPYTLQHPQLFSQRSIATLLQASGFEVIETAKTTNYFPVPYLLRAALTVFGLPEGLIPAGTAPLAGLKLGNIGTIARKPN
jgi:2-polyprenyl-3-methyl-5-hydroxy-6-metoxy-1,4-benzoquinol methylase